VNFPALVLVLLTATACAPPHGNPRAELARLGVVYSADSFVAQADAGDAKAVELFLTSGMGANTPNEAGATALTKAAAAGQVAVVSALLRKGADVEVRDRWNQSALLLAVRARHAAVVKLLLDNGARAYEKGDAWSPLALAAFLGDLPIVNALLARNAAVDAPTHLGYTPLMHAAGAGRTDVVRALLAKGADVAARDPGGYTALMFAANNGHLAVARLLKDAGADLTDKNRNGQTAASYALVNGHREIIELWQPTEGRESGPAPAVEPRLRGQQERRAQFRDAAQAAWSFANTHYEPATGLSRGVASYQFITIWDVGSMLASLYCAHGLQIINDKTYDTRMGKLLETLARMPLDDGKVPGRSYDSRTGAMVDRAERPTAAGTGFSATDIGRLLIWLKIVGSGNARFQKLTEAIVKRIDMERIVQHGYLMGEDVDASGKRITYQEGRIGYEQYAAQGFAAWGHRAEKALNLNENALPLTILGQELAADARGSDRLTSEPFVMMGLELGFAPDMAAFVTRMLRAQEARYRNTGVVTMLSEDSLNQPPAYFYYYCLFANGRQFAIDVQIPGAVADGPRWISTKAAFAFHALMPSGYTQLAVDTVSPARSPRGWGSGVYEGDRRSTGTENINTAAVVLTAALYEQRGQPLVVTASASR
jgi:hypothetical protein